VHSEQSDTLRFTWRCLGKCIPARGIPALRCTEESIRADLDAPKNADGTINLVHYAAWLAGIR